MYVPYCTATSLIGRKLKGSYSWKFTTFDNIIYRNCDSIYRRHFLTRVLSKLWNGFINWIQRKIKKKSYLWYQKYFLITKIFWYQEPDYLILKKHFLISEYTLNYTAPHKTPYNTLNNEQTSRNVFYYSTGLDQIQSSNWCTCLLRGEDKIYHIRVCYLY